MRVRRKKLFPETVDSIISPFDSSLSRDGYNLIRADNPKNIKMGGVCIYHRETIPVKTVQINYLPECLVCEVNYENKKFFIVALYQPPNQNNDEFEEFLGSFENVITGDSNACSSSWWGNDITSLKVLVLKF